MADRITQLQDAVNQLADHFCNSIGILQQSSQPGAGSQLSGLEKSGHDALFGTLIARTAKDIDFLIESLPSEECSSELQNASLQKLEESNLEAGKKLEETVKDGENFWSRFKKL